jgi:sporulation protein YlmC with PRC-barrel domain
MKTIKTDPSQGGASDAWLSDISLRGRTVISAEGLVIGEVTALFFDPSAWQVGSLQVKLRKEIADRLGVDRNVFRAGALEVPVRMVQAVGDTLVLSIAVDGLREVSPSESEAHPTESGGAAAHA